MTVPDRKIVEAVLLLADDPVDARLLGEVLERPQTEVRRLLEELAASYATEDRGFVLRESAAGWRLYTDPACAPWLERFVRHERRARLSPAALEVLAVVAYRQPISRAQIAEIRGVDSDRSVKTLLQRGLIEECGRGEGPGAPVLLRVTDTFLERMGLRSTDELPRLQEFMPDAETVEDMEARLSPEP